MAKLASDEGRQTVANGMGHSTSYDWDVPNDARKMLLMLTTVPSSTARVRVLGAAAMISQ
jgi:hypothetical protein